MSHHSTIQSIRGMNDWGSDASERFHQIEQAATQTFAAANYLKVRLPVLEQTELFARAVGHATDIVEKEMYSFVDRNEQRISLRPEGTAGLVRAVTENSWWQQGQVMRYQYLGPMFRRERPQKGRYRQFTQFGAEVFGGSNPIIDSELIQLSYQWLSKIGVQKHVQLHLNTIGKSDDRKRYRQALVDYLTPIKEQLDQDSQRRIETNPLRILDSKIESTQKLLQHAPRLADFLSEESALHFSKVVQCLQALGIDYQIDSQLVRGLDYYNDTVFEWVTDKLGSQSAICGGGRYDGLVADLGGRPCPACGFAAGLERIEALLEAVSDVSPPATDIYVICQNDDLSAPALSVAAQARQVVPNANVLCDSQLGSLKSQFKRADKSGAKIALIVAEQEYNNQSVIIKALRDDKQQQQIVLLSQIAKILPTYFK